MSKKDNKRTEEEKLTPEQEEQKTETQKENQEEKNVKEDPKDTEINNLRDQLMRSMAEYDNYRKRTAKERMELEPDITSKIVSEFLPVMDNVERALKNECSDNQYKKGIEMIYESFKETLTRLGVEEIETENADFDPNLHQAVQQIQSDEIESGKIANTFQKGYKIGNKILRFAMVAVVA